jgi:hypothetical protein
LSNDGRFPTVPRYTDTQLTDHIVEEVLSGLTALETIIEGRLVPAQLLQQTLHIAWDQVKGRDGKRITLGSQVG